MLEEFHNHHYPAEQLLKMEASRDEETGIFEYELDLEYPYGTFESQVLYRNNNKPDDDDENELKPLIDSESQYVFKYFEPKPISAEEQRQLDLAEEEDNKRREHEAWMA